MREYTERRTSNGANEVKRLAEIWRVALKLHNAGRGRTAERSRVA